MTADEINEEMRRGLALWWERHTSGASVIRPREIKGVSNMSNVGSTNNDKRHLPLRIERMPDGGFVVSEASFGGDPSRFCGPLFASSSIGEALAFIAGRLDPKPEFITTAGPISVEASRCGICKSSGMGRYCSRPNCTERGLGY